MKRFMFVLLWLAAACTPAPTTRPTLTVLTHDSFSVSEGVLQAFETSNDVTVNFVKAGDAGATLNKAILSGSAPLADVLFGVDNTFLTRALDADIFVPYQAPALESVSAEFKLDPSNQVTPVDYGDVCINYDKAFFATRALPIPATLEDLTRPAYNNMLVLENPATSSPGLAFLLLTIKHFGEAGYLDYWRALRTNGAAIVDGWETAYYTNFSASSGRGPQPMVVSYATSPAAEVIFAEKSLTESPTASVLGTDTCFRQIEFVGILKGTRHMDVARRFVDFMLSPEFQADVPLQMFVYPVRGDASLPDAFAKYAPGPSQPASMPPDQIARNRESWIRAWTNVMLH